MKTIIFKFNLHPAMYLLILLEIFLLVAITLLFVMKRKITRLLNENVRLCEKIYQLRNRGNEKALPHGHSHWEILEPYEFTFDVKRKDNTRRNKLKREKINSLRKDSPAPFKAFSGESNLQRI